MANDKSRPHKTGTRRGRASDAMEDWHLWTEVAKSVTPLHPEKELPETPAPDQIDGRSKPDFAPKTKDGGKLFRTQTPAHNTSWSVGAYAAAGSGSTQSKDALEPRMRRHVHRGRVPIDARLDLHGLRQDEAQLVLINFVHTAQDRGHRTLLVITGKGMKKTDPETIFERGVLRHLVPMWLNQPPLSQMVSGFEVSARHHGGEGAYYVRLKRR